MVMYLALFVLVGCMDARKTVGSGADKKEKRCNVVFISLDTTRADYVDTGAGSGARAFTPELRRFARKGIAFDNAYCTIPQTLPSHTAIFTSHFPHECGVLSNEYSYDGRYKMLPEILKEKGYYTAGIISLGTLNSDTGFNRGFDEFRENLNEADVFFVTAERVTAEALQILEKVKREGHPFFLFLHYSDPHSPYAPPTVRGNFKIYLDAGQNPEPVVELNAHQGAILRKDLRLSSGVHEIRFKLENHKQDFDGFVLRRLKFSKNCKVSYQGIEYSRTYYDGSHVIKGSEGVVRVTCRGEGYMKLFQVIPLPTWKAAADYYRKEVEYMDRYVGKFLWRLEEEQLLGNTLVVITGDHGEGLGERERYFGHVRYLNRQFIHVPLIMYVPGITSRRVTVPVSHIGITPTVLEFMGISCPDVSMDKSLARLITTNAKPGDRKSSLVYSYAFQPTAVEDKVSVISWPYQCILSRGDAAGETREFYNLSLSPSFRKWDEYAPEVLARNAGQVLHLLRRSVNRMSIAFIVSQFARLQNNPQNIEKLKTMGYLQ
jgi:membrane-anchored protein YejM (alkaline phosphatase superfamily)